MQSLLIITNSLAVLAALVLLFSLLNRYDISAKPRHIAMGIAFGCGAILTLAQPLQIAAGVQIDGRNLFIAFSGAIAGSLGAAITLALAGIARFMIGGIGVLPGILSMTFCALMGLLWRKLDHAGFLPARWRWIALGGMISASIPILLLLPYPFSWLAFSQGGPFLAIIYMTGAVLLGFLFENERRLDAKRRELVAQAETDPLTAILNRRGLFKKFSEALSAKPLSSVAVMMLDVDKFKTLNDKFGHDMGDRALLSITSQVQSIIRENDLFARTGGDEFVVCIFGVTEQQSVTIKNKLQEKLKLELKLDNSDKTEHFSVSVGSVFSHTENPDLKQLLNAADAKMMATKQTKHNDRRNHRAG